ncbi:hypothetical protein ACWKX9_05735 [Enterobacter asburiae]
MTVKITVTIQDKGDQSQVEVIGESTGRATANEMAHAAAMAQVITMLATEINEGKHRKKPFSSFMKDCINGRHGLH